MSCAQPLVPKPVTDFGIALKRLRVRAGLSQEELAERARISVQAVGAYERGDRHAPRRDTLELIVHALNIADATRDELVEAADRARRRGPNTADATFGGETQRSNLPIARTALVGRDRDVTNVKSLVQRHRLLTLVGEGGIGKTRLAIQVGVELLDRYPDGVWFVDLAAIHDPELVASVVAQALGMSQQQERRVIEAIPPWLRRKKLLLILDNCEHLIEPATALADTILTVAQDVSVLATSRQALEISGEAVHRVVPLSVPEKGRQLRANDALNYGAVALFVERASAVDTQFVLTDNTAPIVSDICQRLDGIALAIELAAARVKVLSIPNLARGLDERFKILTAGNRNALPRQKTLTALIDWSYELLAPQERLLFSRLGIFAGGSELDAIVAVCADEGLEAAAIFDLLASLTGKSLVVADTGGDREQYRLLESTAAYAREKLVASGDGERLARRHAEYFLKRAHAANERVRAAAASLAWLAGIEAALGNFRAAMEWALTQGNDAAALGGEIAGSLSRLWQSAGLGAEGRYWVELALPLVSQDEHPAIAARLQLTLGLLSVGKRKYDAAQRAIALYQSVGDTQRASRARRIAAQALYQMGRLDEAAEELTQTLAVVREIGDVENAAYCLNQLALVEWRRGDFHAGRALFAQALDGLKALGDTTGAGDVLGNMAELEFALGDPARALRLLDEALALTPLEKAEVRAAWHSNAAAYRVALGDVAGARDSARNALRLDRQDRPELVPWALGHLAVIAALDGDTHVAAQLLGYVNARYDELGMKREPTEQWSYDKLLATLRDALREDEIAALAAEGAAWSEDRALEEVQDLQKVD